MHTRHRLPRSRGQMGRSALTLLCCLAAFLAVPTPAVRAQLSQSKLVPAERDTTDFFGDAISVSGNRILAGAFSDDEKGTNAGAAYVFERINGQWQETAKLLAGDGDELDFFGTDVALDGDRALIGADTDGEIVCPPPSIFDVCFTGTAFVFEYENGRWDQTAMLTPATPFFNNASGAGTTAIRFGRAVALNGDRAIVSAPDDFEADVQAGSIHVFDFAGGTWTEQQKITATGIGAGGHFLGFSLDVDGDRLVAGAPVTDVGGVRNAGVAVVFDRIQGLNEWSQSAILEPADPDTSATVGRNVEVEGDWALVGAAFDHEACLPGTIDPDECFGGAVFVFKRGTGAWSLVDKLTANDAGEGDLFGLNLLVEGDRAYIGAPREDEGCPPGDPRPFGCDAGAVYSYQLVGDQWQFQDKLIADDDTEPVQSFGLELAMDGPWLAVGAPSDVLFGQDSIPDFGAIYVYKMFNRDPVAQDDEAATDAGAPVTIDVLANDSDPDADALSVSIATQPANGAATVNADRTITYTPNAGFFGDDTFVYQIDDGDGGADQATVAVTGGNAPPVLDQALGDVELVLGGDPFTSALATVFSDPDADPLTFSAASSNTAVATATVSGQTLTVEAVALGNATITVTAEDGNGGAASDSFAVNIRTAVAVEQGEGLPATFELSANYPNPFNPTTQLRFAVPQPAQVRLAVYDVLGREVAVLVEGRLPAGWHEAVFEAGDLPSGVYVYQLETAQQTLSRSMLLLK